MRSNTLYYPNNILLNVLFNDYNKSNLSSNFIQLDENQPYIPYSGCVFEHILRSDDLNNQEKLFYLLADSLSLISSKKGTEERSVALSSSSWAAKLNCSKSEIFCMQKSLEKKGYFIIVRERNRLGKNKRNVIIPTLPDEIFEQLKKHPDRFNANIPDYQITPFTKRLYLDQTKLFIRVNYQLLSVISAEQLIGMFGKVTWLYVYLVKYKHSIKSYRVIEDDDGSITISYNELQNILGCSKAVLSKTINQLVTLGFLTKQRFHVKNDDQDDNLHDKSLWNINLCLPAHYYQKMNDQKPRSNAASTINTSISDPYVAKFSQLLNKDLILNNKNIDILDGDTKFSKNLSDKSSLSEFYKNSFEEDFLENENSNQQVNTDITTNDCWSENINKVEEGGRVEEFEEINIPSKSAINEPKLTKPIKLNAADKLIKNAKTNKLEEANKTVEEAKSGKSLELFHPLTKEQVDRLNHLSNREFSINFANQLLLKLHARDSNKRFLSKNHMLSYMSKAFRYELHQTMLVNHETFRFASHNPIIQDSRAREKYLAEVEYSVDTSYYSQLRRKIASIFESNTAYRLLTEGKFDYEKADEELLTDPTFRIGLPAQLILTERQQESLGKAIYTVYGFTEVIYEKISPDKFIKKNYKKNIKDSNLTASKKSDQKNSQVVEDLERDRDTAWYKIRQQLKADLGEFIDKTWLSKLTAEEDLKSKTLNLYAPSNFIRDWVTNNYRHRIRQICQAETDFLLDEIATIKLS